MVNKVMNGINRKRVEAIAKKYRHNPGGLLSASSVKDRNAIFSYVAKMSNQEQRRVAGLK